MSETATAEREPIPIHVEEMELDEAKASKRLRNGLISLVVLIAMAIGLLLEVPGLHNVADTVTEMPIGLVMLAIFLEVLSCVGYIICFLQVFDRAPVGFGARVAMSELAFGAAVSLGGAGSVAVGALLLVERGAPVGRVAERSAVLFLLTSAINVITLALAGLLAWTGILPGSTDPWLTLVPGLIALVAFFGFLLLPVVTDRVLGPRPAGLGSDAPPEEGRMTRWARATSDTIRATARLLFSRDWRLVGAFGYLWFDIAVLAVCFWASGYVPPLAVIVLSYQIGYLSNLIPIPGGIGVLDGSFVGMFVLFGVSATTATSATIVYHAISLWVPAMWGTAAFIRLRRSRKEPLELRPPREERRALKAAKRALRAASRH
jgi:uncharacterized membrane protein YbhN (UPF0104 family)